VVHNPGETGGERYHGYDCFDAIGAGISTSLIMDAGIFLGRPREGLCPRLRRAMAWA